MALGRRAPFRLEALALLNCNAAASAGTWRRKPPAAHMALGGSETALRLLSRMPNPYFGPLGLSSVADSALRSSPEPPDTDPYVRWCGRGSSRELPPIPIAGAWAP